MSEQNRPAAQPADVIIQGAAKKLRDVADDIENTLTATPPRGVILIKGSMGYDVQVDGRPLGTDTSWSDADRLCRAIASRRPPGEEMGYGHNYHNRQPFGASETLVDAVVLGVAVQRPNEWRGGERLMQLEVRIAPEADGGSRWMLRTTNGEPPVASGVASSEDGARRSLVDAITDEMARHFK